MSIAVVTPTMSGIARKDFIDAGTGQSFVAGAVQPFEPGQFANYQAAGLIDAAPTAEPAA